MKQSPLHHYNDQQRHLFYDEPKPFKNKMLQIIKIFDGFFIGNEYAGQYCQFINNNKVSLIINTAPQEFEVADIKHIEIMNYDFYDMQGDLLQKLNINKLLDIIVKLDSALHLKCQGAVIISKNIDSRVITIAILYFMIKYAWNFGSSFQFLQSKNSELNISSKFNTLLEKFNKNGSRLKLSEAFATDRTQHEEIILKNTFKNSIIINLPNFHGLDYSKPTKQYKQIAKDSSPLPKGKKVKFAQLSQDVMDTKYAKYLKKTMQDEHLNTKPFKISEMQKRLKTFIKDKSYLKQHNNGIHKISNNNNNDSQNDIIMIGNKELSKKTVAQRRPVSRTEESVREQGSPNKYNNYFNVKIQPNLQNNRKTYSPHKVKANSRLQSLSFMQQKSRQTQTFRKNSDRMYIIHNKKIKHSKRCNTEQPINSQLSTFAIDDFKEEQDHQKVNSIFKISKSNKTSTHKIKGHIDNGSKLNNYSNNLTKYSQKSMKMAQQEDISRYWQQNSSKHIQKQKEKNIINVNVNVQIQNYNVVSDKTQRTLDDYRRHNYRVFHSKKLTKRLVE